MTDNEITVKASLIVRVLEMTMQNVTPKDIADRLGIQSGRVQAIQNAHGYPNERTMLDQVRQMLPLKDQTVTFDTDLTPEPPREDRVRGTLPPGATVQRSGQRPTLPQAATVTLIPDNLQTFLENARKHARPAIANEAEWIIARIARLRDALTEVDADQKRLDEIAKLEARLAELRGVKVAKSRQVIGEYPCDQCSKVAASGTGLAAHKRAAHGGAA